ncbi:MAG: FAD-dependent thymidylate synthase [Bacilli bacterium]
MAEFQLCENSITYIPDTDFYDKISLVAHNCYQVGEKGHEDNVAFVKRLIASGHYAMIEHYRFLFRVDIETFTLCCSFSNPYFTAFLNNGECYISCSLRGLLDSYKEVKSHAFASVLIQSLPENVKTLCVPLERKAQHMELVSNDEAKLCLNQYFYELSTYVTYQIITDRGVTHEIVRHRPCSFAQESTRYCNYTKDKFSNSLTFMKPLGYDENKEVYDSFYQKTADTYFQLISNGAKPDFARSVLPNSLKASIMVTCSIQEWRHIFELRCSEAAHPDIRRVMEMVRDDMKNRQLLTDDDPAVKIKY